MRFDADDRYVLLTGLLWAWRIMVLSVGIVWLAFVLAIATLVFRMVAGAP